MSFCDREATWSSCTSALPAHMILESDVFEPFLCRISSMSNRVRVMIRNLCNRYEQSIERQISSTTTEIVLQALYSYQRLPCLLFDSDLISSYEVSKLRRTKVSPSQGLALKLKFCKDFRKIHDIFRSGMNFRRLYQWQQWA